MCSFPNDDNRYWKNIIEFHSLIYFVQLKEAAFTINNISCQKFGQQIYRIFSLLVNIKKDFSKQFNNNQQYFWSNYQQSTSKIMAKSTINKKVCTPSSNLHNTSKTSGNLLWNIWVSTSIFIHQNKIIPALKQNLLQDHSQPGVNSNKL